MSEEEEYIDTESLVGHLKTIIEKAESGGFKSHELQDVFDSTEEYLHPPKPINLDIVRYLTFGWLALETINGANIKIDACPYCMREMDPADSLEENKTET